MKPTKQIIEKVTDEYMCLPSRMSVTEQLDWIKDACSRVAEAARKEERERILKELLLILGGIDKDEIESTSGWWETSKGAEFGAEILEKVKILISNNKDQ